MHSLKSTGIAVLLLAVSVGLYQYSADDNSSSKHDLIAELGVSDGSAPAFNAQPTFNQHQGFNQQPPGYSPNGNAPGQNEQFNGQTNGQLVSANRYPNQTPQTGGSAPRQFQAPSFGQNNGQSNGQLMAPNLTAPQGSQQPLQVNAGSSFDALRDKFNQASDSAINSGQQFNQQFSNRQNGAMTAGEGFAQNVPQFGDRARNQLASNANSLQKNIGNDFRPNMPDLATATAATRQTIPAGRDDGLIDALQTEFNGATEKISMAMPSASDFSAAPVVNSPEIKIGNNFNQNDFRPELKAQPIELAAETENRLASEQSPIGFGGRDFDVQHASLSPKPKGLSFDAPTNIDQAWSQVETMVDQKKFREALALLTRFYRRDDLTSVQRTKLNDWLDALAGKVIYSTENHFTSTSYMIKAGETLTDIANRWNVPAQVVYNINRKRLGNEPNVVAGTELKMINGPFHAEADMSSQTLTLFLNDLYAGRFPVKVGISGDPRPGNYKVVAKSVQGHTWRDADGNDFAPDSPENGYGPYWIGMTGSLCIHAISDDEVSGHSGCIGLNEKDAKDIFGILANSSQVKVIP